MKKITDAEFNGWIFMSSSASGKWLYFNADNTLSAMVEPSNGEVIFIMDLASKEPIYTSINAKKYASFGRRI